MKTHDLPLISMHSCGGVSSETSTCVCLYLNVAIDKNPSYLLIFVPGQRLRSQDKPVLLRAALHDADVDG